MKSIFIFLAFVSFTALAAEPTVYLHPRSFEEIPVDLSQMSFDDINSAIGQKTAMLDVINHALSESENPKEESSALRSVLKVLGYGAAGVGGVLTFEGAKRIVEIIKTGGENSELNKIFIRKAALFGGAAVAAFIASKLILESLRVGELVQMDDAERAMLERERALLEMDIEVLREEAKHRIANGVVN